MVLGLTSLVKSGKCWRISAAVRIGLPVTATRAPNTSASFAGPMMRLFVSPVSPAQSTVYDVPSSNLTTINVCGFFHWTLSTEPSTVMLLH